MLGYHKYWRRGRERERERERESDRERDREREGDKEGISYYSNILHLSVVTCNSIGKCVLTVL